MNIDIADEVDLTESEVREIFDDGLHSLISDIDSSGGLLVGDNASVKSRLQNTDVDFSGEIEAIEAIEDTLNSEDWFNAEKAEEWSSLFREYVETGNEDKLYELREGLEELLEGLDKVLNKYEENVLLPYEEKLDNRRNNVHYAYNYLESIYQTVKYDCLHKL